MSSVTINTYPKITFYGASLSVHEPGEIHPSTASVITFSFRHGEDTVKYFLEDGSVVWVKYALPVSSIDATVEYSFGNYITAAWSSVFGDLRY